MTGRKKERKKKREEKNAIADIRESGVVPRRVLCTKLKIVSRGRKPEFCPGWRCSARGERGRAREGMGRCSNKD